MKWMQHKKSRVIDFFRKQDTDCDGKVTKQQFIDGIIKSGKHTHTQTHSEEEIFIVCDVILEDNFTPNVYHFTTFKKFFLWISRYFI